jgi:iron(III) transport system substrate-binding protein
MRPKQRPGGNGVIRSAPAWAAALALAFPLHAYGRPAGYPRSYDRIVEQANKERKIVIYANTHRKVAYDLFSAFRKLYPSINITYVDGTADSLNDRLVREVAQHHPTADLIWSSGVNLQAKLINDGYAQVYSSPEKPNLPNLAVWKDQGYGVNFEPIVIAYNRRLVPPADVPHSHLDLTRLLQVKAKQYQGKVATYDDAVSEFGRLTLFHDLRATHDTWDLVRALGVAHVRFYQTSAVMLDDISSGQVLIGYNLVGSSALEHQARDPNIGVVFPKDYLLTALPVALIPAEAAHPNAAKLFLDFLLSREGQSILARHKVTPVRLDMAASLGWNPSDPDRVRTIRLGPSLLADLDQQNRARLIKDWRRNMSVH